MINKSTFLVFARLRAPEKLIKWSWIINLIGFTCIILEHPIFLKEFFWINLFLQVCCRLIALWYDANFNICFTLDCYRMGTIPSWIICRHGTDKFVIFIRLFLAYIEVESVFIPVFCRLCCKVFWLIFICFNNCTIIELTFRGVFY